MGRMVQIRNMPESMYRTLKSRAAQADLSLSDYLIRELARSAELPSFEEMVERLRERERVELPMSAAAMIREERDRR